MSKSDNNSTLVFLTIIKFFLKLFWVVVYCWLPIIFPRDAINFSMMPLCGVLMLNFFIGDTWNNWGVERARVNGVGAMKSGFGCGSMILFFLKWSLPVITVGAGSGETGGSKASPLTLFVLLDACSFRSSISRFSTSLISFWIRINPSWVGILKARGENK